MSTIDWLRDKIRETKMDIDLKQILFYILVEIEELKEIEQ